MAKTTKKKPVVEAKKKEEELDKKMRSDLMAKDKVQQEFYRLQREKEISS